MWGQIHPRKQELTGTLNPQAATQRIKCVSLLAPPDLHHCYLCRDSTATPKGHADATHLQIQRQLLQRQLHPPCVSSTCPSSTSVSRFAHGLLTVRPHAVILLLAVYSLLTNPLLLIALAFLIGVSHASAVCAPLARSATGKPSTAATRALLSHGLEARDADPLCVTRRRATSASTSSSPSRCSLARRRSSRDTCTWCS